jgi:ABC-type lipoprotein export system ATPase subunit
MRPTARAFRGRPPADPSGPLVVCDRVAHTYGSGVTAVVAVHGVTCDVTRGDRIALTGPSGSGKSTLLHLIAGLDGVTAGSLSWPGLGGHPLTRPGRVGVVFQGPSLLPALDVAENVAFPLLLTGMPDRVADRCARAALHRVGVGELADTLPDELSGGQSQRVAVARALAGAPALVLADEPTGQLDHATADQLIGTLLAVCDELGAALVIATHDPLIARRLTTPWVMQDGRLLDPADTATSRRRLG